MKRALTAASLLAIVLLLCIGGLYATVNLTESVEKTALAALEAAENNDTERAQELSEQLNSQWEHAQTLLGAFIRHEDLEKISDSVFSLPGLLKDGNTQGYLRECRQMLYTLEHLHHSELPHLTNIL